MFCAVEYLHLPITLMSPSFAGNTWNTQNLEQDEFCTRESYYVEMFMSLIYKFLEKKNIVFVQCLKLTYVHNLILA